MYHNNKDSKSEFLFNWITFIMMKMRYFSYEVARHIKYHATMSNDAKIAI